MTVDEIKSQLDAHDNAPKAIDRTYARYFFVDNNLTIARFLLSELDRLTAENAALKSALEKAEQENRWIPVEDDIPPYGVEVDVVRNGKVEIGWMDEVMVFTHDYTHWRKRPEPPKGD